TVLEELSLYELATRADAIVLARVRRSGSRTTNVRGRLAPVTVTVLEVREWLKGSGRSEVTVIELGGTHGEGRMVVEGTPGYAPGETVVAFLARRSDGFTTLGMAQGKYRVLEANEPNRSRVLRDLRGVSLAGRDATLREGELSRLEPLERFLARIREAVRGRR
ncbi:MAG: hypothetical protein H5U40_12965, partial [Polyangiaceae bacterium]|nr:hypothetical protein [Polyangiaceae bacterium]